MNILEFKNILEKVRDTYLPEYRVVDILGPTMMDIYEKNNVAKEYVNKVLGVKYSLTFEAFRNYTWKASERKKECAPNSNEKGDKAMFPGTNPTDKDTYENEINRK